MARASPPQSTALNPLGSDFDRFLYARVGDDRHGGLLSVVSALARVGVDPWEQASILTRLPVEGAARALSVLLAKLPVGPGGPVDLTALATQLVTLLPNRTSPTKAGHQVEGGGPAATVRLRMRLVLSLVACVLLFLGMQYLLQPTPASGTSATPAVAPVLPPVSGASRR